MSKELDELDRLAAGVMGFKLRANGYRTISKGIGQKWQPTRRIEQAFELLSKFRCYKLDKYLQHYPDTIDVICSASVLTEDDKWTQEFAGYPELAIVRACLEAAGDEIE